MRRTADTFCCPRCISELLDKKYTKKYMIFVNEMEGIRATLGYLPERAVEQRRQALQRVWSRERKEDEASLAGIGRPCHAIDGRVESLNESSSLDRDSTFSVNEYDMKRPISVVEGSSFDEGVQLTYQQLLNRFAPTRYGHSGATANAVKPLDLIDDEDFLWISMDQRMKEQYRFRPQKNLSIANIEMVRTKGQADFNPPTDNRTRCKEVLEGHTSHHQLKCGHFVIATWIERCAQNCAETKSSPTSELAGSAKEAKEDVTTEEFVCPTCLDKTTMMMFLEKREEYQEVKDMEDPGAEYYYLIYIEVVEAEMKRLREKVLQAGRRCREVLLQGEYGKRALSRREQMPAGLRGSIPGRPEGTAHVRQGRSRSPARDTEGKSPREYRSRRDLSPRGVRLLQDSRNVTSRDIQLDLANKMRALHIGPKVADSLAAKLRDLKLKEDTQTEAQQERRLKEHDRRAEASRKAKMESDFMAAYQGVKEGAERAAQQPSTSESGKKRCVGGKVEIPNAQSVAKVSDSAKSPYVQPKAPFLARGTMLTRILGERSQEPSSRGASPELSSSYEGVGERLHRRRRYSPDPYVDEELSEEFGHLSSREGSPEPIRGYYEDDDDDNQSLQENQDYPASEDSEDRDSPEEEDGDGDDKDEGDEDEDYY
ncbi:MAG: hypothetical protein Q9165_003584 [Trypethelium subeluteriae]